MTANRHTVVSEYMCPSIFNSLPILSLSLSLSFDTTLPNPNNVDNSPHQKTGLHGAILLLLHVLLTFWPRLLRMSPPAVVLILYPLACVIHSRTLFLMIPLSLFHHLQPYCQTCDTIVSQSKQPTSAAVPSSRARTIKCLARRPPYSFFLLVNHFLRITHYVSSTRMTASARLTASSLDCWLFSVGLVACVWVWHFARITLVK